MRSMVNSWLREVSLYRNVFADFQVVHFYRWVRSSGALLYDPALRRALNTLMKKLFLQLIAEFQRLGADIAYADFNKIILSTGKRTVADALSYVEFVVQSIRNKELFHSIELSYQQCWDFLLWLDPANFAGIQGRLPRGLSEEESRETMEEEEVNLDMNWNIGEYLPEESNCRERFETIMIKYVESLANVSKGSPAADSVTALSDLVYSTTQSMHRLRPKQGDKSVNAALEFVKAVTKVLSIDKSVEREATTLRRNMLRLIGVGDFSDLAVWKDPCDTFILTEVICKACTHCRDINLCKDKNRAVKDDVPVWLCADCSVCYDTEDIEMRLLDTLQRKIMSYTLQDLRCVRCKQIKRENMAAFCTCAGNFETLISAEDVRQHLRTFRKIADQYNMHLLKETVAAMLAV